MICSTYLRRILFLGILGSTLYQIEQFTKRCFGFGSPHSVLLVEVNLHLASQAVLTERCAYFSQTICDYFDAVFAVCKSAESLLVKFIRRANYVCHIIEIGRAHV